MERPSKTPANQILQPFSSQIRNPLRERTFATQRRDHLAGTAPGARPNARCGRRKVPFVAKTDRMVGSLLGPASSSPWTRRVGDTFVLSALDGAQERRGLQDDHGTDQPPRTQKERTQAGDYAIRRAEVGGTFPAAIEDQLDGGPSESIVVSAAQALCHPTTTCTHRSLVAICRGARGVFEREV
jgi:hypothetical protein